MQINSGKIAVVIPAYKVVNRILCVINSIGSEVNFIYVIDDNCPEKSGEFVAKNCHDKRVTVLMHSKNKGVGGAVVSGIKAAIENNVQIIVKIDGDGQMDPALVPDLVAPIQAGRADCKRQPISWTASPWSDATTPLIRQCCSLFSR